MIGLSITQCEVMNLDIIPRTRFDLAKGALKVVPTSTRCMDNVMNRRELHLDCLGSR